jgi:hypothetical protein
LILLSVCLINAWVPFSSAIITSIPFSINTSEYKCAKEIHNIPSNIDDDFFFFFQLFSLYNTQNRTTDCLPLLRLCWATDRKISKKRRTTLWWRKINRMREVWALFSLSLFFLLLALSLSLLHHITST